MGVRAGIILALPGLFFALLSTIFHIYAISIILSPPSGSDFLGAAIGVGFLFLFGWGSFILSTIFYLASYIASRHSRSRVIGISFIMGGVLFLANFTLVTTTMLPRYRGPLEELVLFAAPLLAQATIGFLCIVAGVKIARRSTPV